jgi:hypothetical protein
MSHHLSEDQICGAIVGQSTIDEQRHVHECAACRAEIERSWRVLLAFRRTAAEQAEQAARRSTPSFETTSVTRRRWEWAVAGTAVVAVVAALMSQAPRQVSPGDPAGARVGSVSVGLAASSEFFPLAYVNVPVTGGHLVRLEVPSSSLAAFGLDPADAVSPRPGAVLADVVVGEDGLARAVRFVRPSGDDITQKERLP